MRKLPFVFFTLAAAAAGADASGSKFDEIIVFGESSSDSGNVALTQCNPITLQPGPGFPLFWAPCTPSEPGTNPPLPGYFDDDLSDGFDGRLTNGPVWAEYLADAMAVDKPLPSFRGGTNYAHAGAKVGPDSTTNFSGETNLRVNLYPGNPVFIPSAQCPEDWHPPQPEPYAYDAGDLVCGSEVPHINTQIQDFFSDGREFTKKSLVFVWGGANDLRDAGQDPNGPEAAIGNIVGNMVEAVGTIAQSGGKHIVVLNQLNAALAPITQASCSQSPDPGSCLAQVNAAVIGFNEALKTAMKDLQRGLREQGYRVRVHYIDVYSAGEAAVRLSEMFGRPFSNTSDAALVPDPENAPFAAEIDPDAEDYLFWDLIHPTTKAHRIIAYQVCKTLDWRIRNFEPQCGSILGIQ